MNKRSFEALKGWDIESWSVPRNALIKMELADFRGPDADPEYNRCEVFFIQPFRAEFAVAPNPEGLRLWLRDVRQVIEPNKIDVELSIKSGGTIRISCKRIDLVFLPFF